jgi:hypothetical protein
MTKLKGCHFDTAEVMEAESQEVLTPSQNTTSRMQLKSGRSAGNGAYSRKGNISRVMMASRPKVSFFYQIATPVPEIMDSSLYVLNHEQHFSYFYPYYPTYGFTVPGLARVYCIAHRITPNSVGRNVLERS